MTEIRNNTASLIFEAITAGVLRKAVLSKPAAPDEIKTELSPIKIGEKTMIRRISLMKDGKAYISEASCPDKICVRTGAADELRSVVCLPNRVKLSVEGK